MEVEREANSGIGTSLCARRPASCDLRAKRSVEKGDATPDFAAQGVVEGVVVWAMRAVERFVAALRRSSDAVAKTHSTACLKFPVVKVQPCLFGWCSPAKTVTDATAREEPGLFNGRKLKPVFLRVSFVNGIGEPAL